MKRAALILVAACSLPLTACLSMDDADQLDHTEQGLAQAPAAEGLMMSIAVDDQKPRGSYMVIPPEYAQQAEAVSAEPGIIAHASWIFYMNKDGGTYTPGTNNASTNRSSIPTQTSVVPPWNVAAADWAEIMTCVRAQFADYDVEITDVDPGAVPHMESVVAGNPQDIGMPNGVGGVSPFTRDCSVIPNSIVFTFAEVFANAPNPNQFICEVVAQEVAHSFGLDHQYLCSDPMTYLSGCGAKSFQNLDALCGEYEARECACGGTTQNSVAMLSARLGIAGGDELPPTLNITSPADGQKVPPGFTINVEASDDIAITRVELYIDGSMVAEDASSPFSFDTDASLADGTYILETRAYDSQNVTTKSISVTVDANADPVDPNDPSDPTDPSDPADDPNDPGVGDSPGDIVGGCQAGGSGGPATMLLFLFGLVFLGRRRVHQK